MSTVDEVKVYDGFSSAKCESLGSLGLFRVTCNEHIAKIYGSLSRTDYGVLRTKRMNLRFVAKVFAPKKSTEELIIYCPIIHTV